MASAGVRARFLVTDKSLTDTKARLILRGPASREVLDSLLRLKASCPAIFLRGNHEAMILDARESIMKADQWRSYGGLETLYSYGGEYRQDWAALIPEAHWGFLESTQRYLETETHIFVPACLEPELDMADQPAWLLYWEHFDRIRRHKSGKRIICGDLLTCRRGRCRLLSRQQ